MELKFKVELTWDEIRVLQNSLEKEIASNEEMQKREPDWPEVKEAIEEAEALYRKLADVKWRTK